MAVRLVALIRGINVGRAKRVAMADLRALLEELGYGDVRTLLNSGNVVFTAPRATPGAAAARIEKAMADRLGVTARITVITAEELTVIVKENPLAAGAVDPSRLLICVLADPADRSKLLPLQKLAWGKEALAVGRRAAYLWCGEGISSGRLFEEVGRALGDAGTSRNVATMKKILALAADGG